MLSECNDEDPTDVLNKLVKCTVMPEYTRWQTVYGVSFEKHGKIGGLWFYRYDSNLTYLKDSTEEFTLGCLSANDVFQAILQFKEEPMKLWLKPTSVSELEKITGKKAVRKMNGFGQWHLTGKGYSMFNNPFGLCFGYTGSADIFEVWYKKHEEKPQGWQTVAQIKKTLLKYK